MQPRRTRDGVRFASPAMLDAIMDLTEENGPLTQDEGSPGDLVGLVEAKARAGKKSVFVPLPGTTGRRASQGGGNEEARTGDVDADGSPKSERIKEDLKQLVRDLEKKIITFIARNTVLKRDFPKLVQTETEAVVTSAIEAADFVKRGSNEQTGQSGGMTAAEEMREGLKEDVLLEVKEELRSIFQEREQETTEKYEQAIADLKKQIIGLQASTLTRTSVWSQEDRDQIAELVKQEVLSASGSVSVSAPEASTAGETVQQQLQLVTELQNRQDAMDLKLQETESSLVDLENKIDEQEQASESAQSGLKNDIDTLSQKMEIMRARREDHAERLTKIELQLRRGAILNPGTRASTSRGSFLAPSEDQQAGALVVPASSRSNDRSEHEIDNNVDNNKSKQEDRIGIGGGRVAPTALVDSDGNVPESVEATIRAAVDSRMRELVDNVELVKTATMRFQEMCDELQKGKAGGQLDEVGMNNTPATRTPATTPVETSAASNVKSNVDFLQLQGIRADMELLQVQSREFRVGVDKTLAARERTLLEHAAKQVAEAREEARSALNEHCTTEWKRYKESVKAEVDRLHADLTTKVAEFQSRVCEFQSRMSRAESDLGTRLQEMQVKVASGNAGFDTRMEAQEAWTVALVQKNRNEVETHVESSLEAMLKSRLAEEHAGTEELLRGSEMRLREHFGGLQSSFQQSIMREVTAALQSKTSAGVGHLHLAPQPLVVDDDGGVVATANTTSSSSTRKSTSSNTTGGPLLTDGGATASSKDLQLSSTTTTPGGGGPFSPQQLQALIQDHLEHLLLHNHGPNHESESHFLLALEDEIQSKVEPLVEAKCIQLARKEVANLLFDKESTWTADIDTLRQALALKYDRGSLEAVFEQILVACLFKDGSVCCDSLTSMVRRIALQEMKSVTAGTPRTAAGRRASGRASAAFLSQQQQLSATPTAEGEAQPILGSTNSAMAIEEGGEQGGSHLLVTLVQQHVAQAAEKLKSELQESLIPNAVKQHWSRVLRSVGGEEEDLELDDLEMSGSGSYMLRDVGSAGGSKAFSAATSGDGSEQLLAVKSWRERAQLEGIHVPSTSPIEDT
ncbi:unnamed protein product [Amoebophrya sp. A25]|nr:unnamed protein product [Amoebophrya sp. A25]|eukprot:GSA25T00006431001.1